jgi:hypothetical protein
MKSIDKQTEDEMVKYIEHLLKGAIYCHGQNLNMIARHLVNNGCRIYIGPRRKKYMEKFNDK